MTPEPASGSLAGLTLVRGIAELRNTVAGWRAAGERIALVPTMGGLHAGHMALVEAAMQGADRTVVSLFVNPAQFGEGEDYAGYPRTEAADTAQLAAAGVDLLFAPAVETMYPDGFVTTVTVPGLSEPLCGIHRPGHFDGVTTVVAKLFTQCGPDIALFGEKDYQQLLVVRRMVRDLGLPVDILAVPTVREADGLALSSRNSHLTAAERVQAGALPRALDEIVRRLTAGEGDVASTLAWGRAELAAAGIGRLDYLELRDARTLETASDLTRPARLFVAAYIGVVRLIDNMPVTR